MCIALILTSQYALHKASVKAERDVVTSGHIVEASGKLKIKFELFKKAFGIKSKKVRLFIDTSKKSPNAMIRANGAIILNQGELDWNKKHPLQLYFVIGHELAHWKNGDVGYRWVYCSLTQAKHKLCEKQADLSSQKYLSEAGYGRCSGGQYWKRWLGVFGNTGGNTHPSAKERYNYLRCR